MGTSHILSYFTKFLGNMFFIFMSIYSNIKKIVYVIEFGNKLFNYLQNQLRKVYEFDKN